MLLILGKTYVQCQYVLRRALLRGGAIAPQEPQLKDYY
jgi:hypothetical protein